MEKMKRVINEKQYINSPRKPKVTYVKRREEGRKSRNEKSGIEFKP